mgnify:CR=1 FL=1
MPTFLQRVAGGAGKLATGYGTFVSGLVGRDVRPFGLGGNALGASLQNFGGQPQQPSRLSFVNPPLTYPQSQAATPPPPINYGSDPYSSGLRSSQLQSRLPTPQVLGQQTSGGAPGGGVPGGGTPGGSSQGAQINTPQVDQGLNIPPPPQPDLQQIDPLFQPALEALTGALGSAQTGYEAQLADINAQKGAQTTQITSGAQEQQNQLITQRASQETGTENAIAQARRGASEIQQGLQARYGGTTGTGAFAGELLGRTAQQTIGQYNQNLINNLQAIDTSSAQVQKLADSALQDLESRVGASTQMAKSALEDRLTQIRLSQGELQGQKAKLTYSAIQNYQQAVMAINQMNVQFKQQLALEQQKVQDYLSLYRSQLQGSQPTFQANRPVSLDIKSPAAPPVQSYGGQLNDPNRFRTDINPLTGQPYLK